MSEPKWQFILTVVPKDGGYYGNARCTTVCDPELHEHKHKFNEMSDLFFYYNPLIEKFLAEHDIKHF